MKVYRLSEIIWTKDFIRLPHSIQMIGLHHLTISDNILTPDDKASASSDSDEAVPSEKPVKEFILSHSRTQEIICKLVIPESEMDAYRNFQNALFASKMINRQ